MNGGMAIDKRGVVRFCNSFNPTALGIKRMYQIENHRVGFVRAWHGHKVEEKYVYVPFGAAVIGMVKIHDWKQPSRGSSVDSVVLSASMPSVLHIPAGYANGSMSLVPDTQIIHFSTVTLEESKEDDFRWDWDWFDTSIWRV